RRSNSDAACRPCCESCGAKTWWRAIVHKSRPEKIPLVGTTAVFRAIPNPYPRKINRLRVQETSKLPNAASNRLTSARLQTVLEWGDLHRCETDEGTCLPRPTSVLV